MKRLRGMSALRGIVGVCVMTTTIVSLLSAGMGATAEELRGAVFFEDIPELDEAFAEKLREVAERAGYRTTRVGAAELSDPAVMTPDRFDVVILPKAGLLPASATEALGGYIEAGGNVMALEAPLWQEYMLHRHDAWIPRDRYEQEMASQEPVHGLFDFSASDALEGWQPSFYPETAEPAYTVVPESPVEGGHALHAYIDSQRDWDSLGTPEFDESPFPPDHILTVFAAKGGSEIYTLSVEWMERDGSRWIATVPLTQQWRRYVLGPDDFKFWESVPARRETTFNPSEAVQFSVGLSTTHTGAVLEGQQYWITAIGTEPLTEDNAPLRRDISIAPHDGLYPPYKYYEISEPVALHTRPDQTILATGEWPAAQSVRAHHPRPGGGGFDKGRSWRWIPLIEARGADDAWRGVPAVLRVDGDGSRQGGQWAVFGIDDGAWYREERVLDAIQALLERMAHGVYLIDGGTQFYTYFDDQSMELGVRMTNLSRSARHGLTARVRILEAAREEFVHEQTWSVDLGPGETRALRDSWTPPDWPEEGYRVVAEMLDGEQVIDRVVHEAHVWQSDETLSPITVDGGEFMLDGERWRAHGVNYMPSSGIGSEDWLYFEQWMGARSYDPEIIQRDLEVIRDMGLNSVAVFVYHDSMGDQNLLDLLRRCETLGLYVNLSLRHRGTTPKSGWDELRPRILELINYYRLAEHSIVFTYDVAWEPMWMTQTQRRAFDAQWEAWIIERYGSIENAERDWEFPVPRDDNGAIVNPTTEQIRVDGPWRRMVAAYRRCLDMLVYQYYSRARTVIHELDPHTHVSFRMAEAGNPTMNWQGVMPYDFAYLAAAVDILEPEAYGRIGDWERVKPGWFTFEYGRWAGPDLPLIWSEAGVSAWDMGLGRSSNEKLAFQGDYFADFYRMMIGSGADGIYWWWYPCGFRVGENSDYGIINPDKTDRPSTTAIRDHAEAFLDGPSVKPVDYWITFDRDTHVDGLSGVYREVEAEFWQAIADGYTPGLRTEGTGTDSGNCPLIAVGNTPFDGSNPPKYLDGFFDRVAVRDHTGEWVNVEQGGSVRVKAGEPVTARITMTNLAEAAWRAEGDGAVVIAVSGSSATTIPLPQPVGRHETITLDGVTLMESATDGETITLRMNAVDRTPFGPIYRITMEPAP